MMSLSIRRRGLIDEYEGYNFRRESMAQDSAGNLIYPHNARFESGPFGSDKAILVEEGTTNLLKNPFFISGLSGWSAQNVYTEDNEIYVTDGVAVIKAVDTSSRSPGLFQNVKLDVGTIVTVSILIRRTSGSTAPRLRWGAGPVIGEIEISENGQWVKYSATTDVQGNGNLIIEPSIEPSIAGQVEYEIKAVQLEQKPYATTLTSSVRANEALTVPIEGLLSPEQGTVEMWAKMPIYNNANFRTILNGFGDGPLHFISLHSGTGRLYARYSSNGALTYLYTSVYNLPEWSLISLVYNDDGVKIYVNRELVGENAAKMDEKATTRFMLGANPNNTTFANGIIAHLRLSSIARTQEQLAPIDAPPTVDEYTTLYLPFNGPDNVRKAKVVTL